MQDAATYPQMNTQPQFPEMEQLKCPRCDSTNTKFCYYNNYNLSQPRHFCKNCRRYWTKGGALRNIPVGGGTRKSNTKKRPKPDPDPIPIRKQQEKPPSLLPAATTTTTISMEAVGTGTGADPTRIYGLAVDQDHKMLDITGSFSSLLANNGGFGSALEGLNSNGSGLKMMQMGGFGESFNSGQSIDSSSGPHDGNANGDDSYLQSGGGGDTNCWGGGGVNGWPDLAIYTPGSNFQ